MIVGPSGALIPSHSMLIISEENTNYYCTEKTEENPNSYRFARLFGGRRRRQLRGLRSGSSRFPRLCCISIAFVMLFQKPFPYVRLLKQKRPTKCKRKTTSNLPKRRGKQKGTRKKKLISNQNLTMTRSSV